MGRSKSSNGDGNHEMKKRIDELQQKIRHLEQMKPKDGQNDVCFKTYKSAVGLNELAE